MSMSVTIKDVENKSFEIIDDSVLLNDDCVTQKSQTQTRQVVAAQKSPETSKQAVHTHGHKTPSPDVPVDSSVRYGIFCFKNKLEFYKNQLNNMKPYAGKSADFVLHLIVRVNFNIALADSLLSQSFEGLNTTRIISSLVDNVKQLDLLINDLYMNKHMASGSQLTNVDLLLPTDTMTSSFDFLSLTSEISATLNGKKAKIVEQNRIIRQMTSMLIDQAELRDSTPSEINRTKSESETARTSSLIGVPIDQQDLNDYDCVSPGTSPTDFVLNAPKPSRTSPFSVFKNLLGLNNSKHTANHNRASNETTESEQSRKATNYSNTASLSRDSTSSSRLITFEEDQGASIAPNVGSNVNNDQNDNLGGNFQSADEAVANEDSNQEERSSSSSETRSTVGVEDHEFHHCPMCDVKVYRDQVSIEDFTKHLEKCRKNEQTLTCIICLKIFDSFQQVELNDHLEGHFLQDVDVIHL